MTSKYFWTDEVNAVNTSSFLVSLIWITLIISAQPQISSVSDFQYKWHLKSSALGLFLGLSTVPTLVSELTSYTFIPFFF